MSYNHHLPKGKISLKPKKHHGWTVVIIILGFFLPPLAVAARFGIGSDFFINCFLTISGYFPGHFHNFYVQNIRNNAGKNRTPKWARKAGLVDTTEDDRRARKSQWAKRYDERNNESTLVGAELADGEEGANYQPDVVLTEEERQRRRNEGLWGREDEENLGMADAAPNQRNWHYPANFEGVADGDAEGADRWERSAAARSSSASGGHAFSTAPSSLGKSGKKSKKSKRADLAAYAPSGSTYGDTGYNGPSDPLSTRGGGGGYDEDVPDWGNEYGGKKKKNTKGGGGGGSLGRTSSYASGGGGNGYAASGNGNGNGNGKANGGRQVEEDWNHQF